MQKTQPITKDCLRGMQVLADPKLNKGSAFTNEEQERLGLVGLLLDCVEDFDRGNSNGCSAAWRKNQPTWNGGAKAHYDGIVAVSQTDCTEDLKKITVPVLVMHGDDDQIVPYTDSAPLSAKLLKNGMLRTYKGCPHGMPATEAETINMDLLAFIKS